MIPNLFTKNRLLAGGVGINYGNREKEHLIDMKLFLTIYVLLFASTKKYTPQTLIMQDYYFRTHSHLPNS